MFKNRVDQMNRRNSDTASVADEAGISAAPGTETYLTVDELRVSYREAARRGRTLEDWALEHVPRILDRLAECPEDSDSPTCPGRWLVFTSPGVAPVIYTVTEDDVIRYSNPNNGYLWWGPLPEIDPESVNDGIDSPPNGPPPIQTFNDI